MAALEGENVMPHCGVVSTAAVWTMVPVIEVLGLLGHLSLFSGNFSFDDVVVKFGARVCEKRAANHKHSFILLALQFWNVPFLLKAEFMFSQLG